MHLHNTNRCLYDMMKHIEKRKPSGCFNKIGYGDVIDNNHNIIGNRERKIHGERNKGMKCNKIIIIYKSNIESNIYDILYT